MRLYENTRAKLLFWFVLIVIFCVSTATAQQSGGSLRGRVLDPAGSVVVGATVTIVAVQGAEKSTTTDGDGSYSFNGLAPGKYTMEALLATVEPRQYVASVGFEIRAPR